MEKLYVLKSDLGVMITVPTPNDLENWLELDYDPAFNYIGKVYNDVTGRFDTATPNRRQLKMAGTSIQGSMISLTEINQNCLSYLSVLADKLGQEAFPMHPKLETKTGKVSILVRNQEEFDSMFIAFGKEREKFFT